MTIKRAMIAAQEADEAFQRAVLIAGYKSRWHWNQHTDAGTEALRAAYRAKVQADNAMHYAFEASRSHELAMMALNPIPRQA